MNGKTVKKAYLKAMLMEKVLSAEHLRRTAHLWEGEVTEADLERIAAEETKVDEELGTWEAHDAVLEAERQLIEWAWSKLKAHPQYLQWQDKLEYVRQNYCCFPKIRQGMIDICLRLEE